MTSPRKTCPDPVQYLGEPFEESDISGYSTPGWYFWEETWAHCQGPFESQEAATKALGKYAETL